LIKMILPDYFHLLIVIMRAIEYCWNRKGSRDPYLIALVPHRGATSRVGSTYDRGARTFCEAIAKLPQKKSR
jgi:hypothetical protein